MRSFNLLLIVLSTFFILFSQKSHSYEICKQTDKIEELERKFDDLYFELEKYSEAFICSKYGASLESIDFEAWLAYFYYNGQGTELNLEEAYKYFKKASDRGDGYSSWYVAYIYSHGIPEINLTINNKKSFEYYKKSYEQNYSYARGALAQRYYFGIGTNIDYEKSFKYLSDYQSTLSNFGKNLLAKHYLLGRGTKQDIAKGVKLLEETMNDGYNQSRETLNVLYGKNYLDRENRKVKSTFFYQYEREGYINFGYNGLIHVEELSKLARSNKYLKTIDYAKKIIDRFINSNNQITEEVCYAVNQLHWASSQLEEKLFTDEELFNLVELNYKNNCGDITNSNYAYYFIWDKDKKDYQKAIEILINDIKK